MEDTAALFFHLLGLTRLGVLLVGLGTLLVLAFGLWLVQLGHWGYGAGWIAALHGAGRTLTQGRPAATSRLRALADPEEQP